METAGGTGAFRSLVEVGAATGSGTGGATVAPEPSGTASPAVAWGKAGSLRGSESCAWGCGTASEDPAAPASFSDGFSEPGGNLASPADLLEVAAGTAVCDELEKPPNERDVEAGRVEGAEVEVLILFVC